MLFKNEIARNVGTCERVSKVTEWCSAILKSTKAVQRPVCMCCCSCIFARASGQACVNMWHTDVKNMHHVLYSTPSTASTALHSTETKPQDAVLHRFNAPIAPRMLPCVGRTRPRTHTRSHTHLHVIIMRCHRPATCQIELLRHHRSPHQHVCIYQVDPLRFRAGILC